MRKQGEESTAAESARWFVGLTMDDPVWHPTTFTKNRDRLLSGDVAAAFFDAVQAHARAAGLLSDEHFTVDGTQLEAWASLKSFRCVDAAESDPPEDPGNPRSTSTGRATGAAAERDRRGRFSARRKRATVLRLLRGEDLESVSRELGITAALVDWASQWRDQFLAAGQAGLKSRAPDARDEAHQRLHAKVGELLMENELLYVKVDHLEAGGGPLARRRSTR